MKKSSWGRKLILCAAIFFPLTASAHLIAITPLVPFPISVSPASTFTATFLVTNIATTISVSIINQSQFSNASGLTTGASTCGALIGPGESCSINIQLLAPVVPQTITGELRVWAKPSADDLRYPFTVIVTPQSTG